MNRRRFAQHLAATVGALSVGRVTSGQGPLPAPSLRVDGDRVNRHLAELSAFGKNDYGGVSRVAYSDFDEQGREWAMVVMREAGLTASIDAAGNIVGRRAGSNGSLKPIVFGSHIDSVPSGAATPTATSARECHRSGANPRYDKLVTKHPLEVVSSRTRKAARWGAPRCRRADRRRPGPHDPQRQDHRRRDRLHRRRSDEAGHGETNAWRRGGLRRIGHRAGRQPHREKLDIGVVEGIVGIGQWEVTAEGMANHAGTTAMSDRRDSLLATGDTSTW